MQDNTFARKHRFAMMQENCNSLKRMVPPINPKTNTTKLLTRRRTPSVHVQRHLFWIVSVDTSNFSVVYFHVVFSPLLFSRPASHPHCIILMCIVFLCRHVPVMCGKWGWPCSLALFLAAHWLSAFIASPPFWMVVPKRNICVRVGSLQRCRIGDARVACDDGVSSSHSFTQYFCHNIQNTPRSSFEDQKLVLTMFATHLEKCVPIYVVCIPTVWASMLAIVFWGGWVPPVFYFWFILGFWVLSWTL